MKKLTSLLTIVAFILAISSCKKNELSSTDVIVPYDPGTTITTAVAGKVTNQNGDALNGVEITIGSSKVITDASGQFIIPKATLSQNAGLIKATKAGYFAGSRTIKPKEKVVNNIVIQLVKKTESGNFTNASGGTITVATGGNIVFPANAVVTKSGAAYTGSVKVAAYFLDPTSNNCVTEMPGDLRGINTSNNEQVLTSYGMMAVELQGSNGETLQMASGKKATITFPIAAATQSQAPTTIPLWFFDETKGLWVEEGTATKTGNNYVGDVAHFTWWNCDWGGGPITLTAKFVDQNGNALDNYHVYFITSAGWGGGGGSGWTASDGSITGNIPANKNIVATIVNKNYCSGSYSTLLDTTVGSFTQNTDLGTITVNVANLTATSITIKGTVNDCNNNPVTNGYALIKLANGNTYYKQITNGNFSKSITYCSAVPATTATVTVFDLNTLKQNATPITVNVTGAGTFNVGTVQACGVQNIVRYIAGFVDQNGAIINGTLRVTFTGDSTQSYYLQAPGGGLNVYVQANKILTRKVYYYDNCQNQVLIDSTQIGPFSTDYNAGVISVTVPIANTVSVTGTVKDCNNNNVNGIATLILGGATPGTRLNIINGNVLGSITNCGNVTSGYLNVEDTVNHQQNATPIAVSVINNTINFGTVQACGVSLTEFLNYTIGNTTYNAKDSLTAYNIAGAGTYLSGMAFNPYGNFNANFSGNNIGTFNLNLTHSDALMTSYTSVQGTTVTITEYGNVGGYIAGTFSGNVVRDSSTIITAISGSFRIKRVQ